ncbi:LysR family transcriptional regulator [Microvirga vignae]|uniref:LysR family transcriptional regulator n=1 Tax=Microvirga vignae TaxID=1225564 RepID=A0A0H1R919_9HYPH|nr:LysR substrate-binding domain-containing protein [Microvirga vignae]KLK91306.1 LysR family transcriptional regulator [Microvirga vignae]
MARLNPRQIEAFRSVMVTGGITPAAEMMNVTQPAVSRLIRDLEASVALKLFEREGSRLTPSSEAILLFREVDRLYLGLDQIARAADDIRSHKNIVLRIATVPSLVKPYLHEVISGVLGRQADLPLVIDVESTSHISEMMAANRYDLGFIYGSPRSTTTSVETLYTTRAVAAVAPDHELATHEKLTIEDLCNFRVLIPGRKTPLRVELDRILARKELTTATAVETSMLNCCYLAASGTGVAIVDPVTVMGAEVKLVQKPFIPEIPISYLAVKPPQSAKNQIVDHLVDEMRRLITQQLHHASNDDIDYRPQES